MNGYPKAARVNESALENIALAAKGMEKKESARAIGSCQSYFRRGKPDGELVATRPDR